MLFAFGLLASLEVSSDTPGALCPPPDQARRAIVERVGEVDAVVSVRYGVVQRGIGGAISLHIAISTGEECGPTLNRDYPIESGSCDDSSELLATVVEGFITDPPVPAACSDRSTTLHACADVTTVPAFGGSLGLEHLFRSKFFVGAGGTLVDAPAVRLGEGTTSLSSPHEFWALSGRLLVLGGYTLPLGSRVETDLVLGAGPGFDLGQLKASDTNSVDGEYSRLTLLTEAQSRWRYRLSTSWALEMALKGSWYFYQMPVILKVREFDDQSQVQDVATNTQPLPALQASLSLGMAYRF